jgi:tetratricopeptide (TPR) repeat protein
LEAKEMNDSDPILTELRKISAWADIQRKVTKWTLICIAVIIPALVIIGVVAEHQVTRTIENETVASHADWYDVDADVRRGEFEKAIQLGQQLIQKTPESPEAQRRLAGAYLATGRIRKAREHYAEAFRLFPSEENQKLLTAIDQRIKGEGSQQGGANGSQPGRSGTNQASAATGSRRSP